MSIKFIHIRPGVRYDSVTKTLQGTPEAKGGVTIAFSLVTDSPTPCILISLARCHERDSYSRSRGRLISMGRLVSGKADLFITVDVSKGIVEQVVEAVGTYLDECEQEREAA